METKSSDVDAPSLESFGNHYEDIEDITWASGEYSDKVDGKREEINQSKEHDITTSQKTVKSYPDVHTNCPNGNAYDSDINMETEDPQLNAESEYIDKSDGDKNVNNVAEAASVDILGNNLLLKMIIVEGDGRRPVRHEVVTVAMYGELDMGLKVDENDSLTFTLGDGDVITGLELCVPMMKLNETCTLKTDSKYAHGKRGNGNDVPPDATITYTITLTAIDPAPDYSSMEIDEIIRLSQKKRERGNYYFERADFISAITSYNTALTIADSYSAQGNNSTEQLQLLLDIRVKCCNNLAASQLKIEAYQTAIKSCDYVLKHSPENIKALFRKSKACSELGKTKDACTLLKKALKLNPESRLIHVELSRISQKMKSESESTKKMYQKMLGLNNADKPKTSSWATWSLSLSGLAVIVAAVTVGIAFYRQH